MSNSLSIKNNINSMRFYRYGTQYIELLTSDGSPFDESLYSITLETPNGNPINNEKFETYLMGNRAVVHYFDPNSSSGNNSGGNNYGGSGGSSSGGGSSSSGGNGSNANSNLNYTLVLYPSEMTIWGAANESSVSRYIFAVLQGRNNFNSLIYQREVTDITLESATNDNVTTEYIKESKTIKFTNFTDGDTVSVVLKYESILGVFTQEANFTLKRKPEGTLGSVMTVATTGAYALTNSNKWVIFSCRYYGQTDWSGTAGSATATDFGTGIITKTEVMIGDGDKFMIYYNNTTEFDLPILASLNQDSHYILIPHGTDNSSGVNIIIDSTSLPNNLTYSFEIYPENVTHYQETAGSNNINTRYVFGILKGVDSTGNFWYQRDVTSKMNVEVVSDSNNQFVEYSSKQVKFKQQVSGTSSFSLNFKYNNSQNNLSFTKTFTLNIKPIPLPDLYYIFNVFDDLNELTNSEASVTFNSMAVLNPGLSNQRTITITPAAEDGGTEVVTSRSSINSWGYIHYKNTTPFDIPVRCSIGSAVYELEEYFIAPHGTDIVSYDNCTYKIKVDEINATVNYYIDNLQDKTVTFNAHLNKYVNSIPQNSSDWESIDVYYKDSDSFTTNKNDLEDKFITLTPSGSNINISITQKDFIYDLMGVNNFYIKSIINNVTYTSDKFGVKWAQIHGYYPYYYGLLDEGVLTKTGTFSLYGKKYSSNQNLLSNKQYVEYAIQNYSITFELELDSNNTEKVLYIGSSLNNSYPFWVSAVKHNEETIYYLEPGPYGNNSGNTDIIHPARIEGMLPQAFVSIPMVFSGTYEFTVNYYTTL